MQAIFSVTVPFFALVLAGWLAARRGILPPVAIPGLNAFVLYFALPCMLLRFGMSTPVMELLNPSVLGVYLLAAALIVGFTVAVTRSPRVHLKDAAFGALVAAFPNSGFMGVPLLVALMGPQAAGPVICIVLADMIVTSSACLAIAQLHEAGGLGPGATALRAVRGAFSNPLPWSIGAGVLLGVTGLPVPGPLLTVVRMLADAATPVALFTIGAVLWRAGAQAVASGVRPPLSSYLPVALVKLLLHPLAVLLLGRAAQALGAPLSTFQLTVLTLAAALPSASNVSLLAERYAADTGRVARIILASTLMAFVSFSLLAGWFGVQPQG